MFRVLWEEGEGAVLGSLHQFALARSFIIEAAEMQNAMNDDAVQLLFIGKTQSFGVCANRVEADEEVAADEFRTAAVVEGDDVGVVVVLQELTIDAEYFFVIDEYVVDVASATAIGSRYGTDPRCDDSLVDGRHLDVYGLEGYH